MRCIVPEQFVRKWRTKEEWNWNSSYLEIWSKVFRDEWTIALREHHDLLLDVFDFIFGLLEIDYFYGNNLLRSVVNSFEYFAETSFANSFLFSEYQLRINLLKPMKASFISKDLRLQLERLLEYTGIEIKDKTPFRYTV